MNELLEVSLKNYAIVYQKPEPIKKVSVEKPKASDESVKPSSYLT